MSTPATNIIDAENMDAQEMDSAALPLIDDTTTAFSHQPEHGFSLFLAKRTKTIHFIRHAEGLHNQANAAAGDDTPVTFDTPGSERYVDAKLTKHGIQQCLQVRNDGKDLDNIHPQLIVVSPFTRTLQTAHVLFAGQGIPFVVHDLCRERSGKFTCDQRRGKTEIVADLQPLYDSTGDTIDFDSYGYPHENDVYWTTTREPSESVLQRGIQLVHWLAMRPETELAVVSHSSFLKHLFRAFGQSLHHKDQRTLHRIAGNAEVRSVCLALHRGFYPPGEWHGDRFVPLEKSFRRGKWAPSQEQVADLHAQLVGGLDHPNADKNGKGEESQKQKPNQANNLDDDSKSPQSKPQDSNAGASQQPDTNALSKVDATSSTPSKTSNHCNSTKTTILLELLDVTKAVEIDPNAQRLLLKLNDDNIPFLDHACKADTWLALRFPNRQETATVRHQITKYLQTKDKYTAAASMLFKSQAFLQIHQHDPRVRPTQLVDLPRTPHNKPYIPLDPTRRPHHILPDGAEEDEAFPISISHQFPLVGMARTSSKNNNDDDAITPVDPALWVGLDIVIFDPINTKLYETDQEFLDVFRESFTASEWNCIVLASSPLKEFYVRWAMKEAYTKARGLGMGIDFHNFEISLDDLETSGHKNTPISSLWKYILKQQRRKVALKQDTDKEDPDPLELSATVRFLSPSPVSRKNERYTFFFLPLENGKAKGCACVCVGPMEENRRIDMDVTWTSLDKLMEWHGGH